MKEFNITKGIKGFIKWYNLRMKLKEYLIHPEIEKKEEIYLFYKKYKLQATIDAFKKSKSFLYSLAKKLKENNFDFRVLKNKSTRPKNVRQKNRCPKIITEIIRLRKKYPKIGKDKLHHLLKENQIKKKIENIPSSSTIGRILTELKEQNRIDEDRYKTYINGRTGKIHSRKTKKKKKNRQRDKDFSKAKEVGHIQIDTIVEIQNNKRRYIIQGVDVFSRIAFSYAYQKGNSLSAMDFIIKLQEILPYPIKRIQTDNGSEFDKHFSEYLAREDVNIPLFKTYPQSPKMNAKVERFNRTTQEEFYRNHQDDLFQDIKLFNEKLMKWLVWYNIDRPHWSLKFNSPLKSYLYSNKHHLSNMYWTYTPY